MLETTCPVCLAAGARVFAEGDGDASRRIERRFRFYACGACGLRFQRGIERDEAARLYADLEEAAVPTSALTGRRAVRADDEVVRLLRSLTAGRRFLDVGAGAGYQLEAAVRAGFDAVGTDVSPRLAELARERSKAPVLVGQLADLKLASDSFDVVNCDQVLMYVMEPRAFVAEIARLLRPGGIFRVREYDARSLSARIASTRYWAYKPTRVTLWTRRALRVVTQGAGLRPRRVVPGTEASLASWLEAERVRTARVLARAVAQYALRKTALGDFAIGADASYFFEKPCAPLRPPRS